MYVTPRLFLFSSCRDRLNAFYVSQSTRWSHPIPIVELYPKQTWIPYSLGCDYLFFSKYLIAHDLDYFFGIVLALLYIYRNIKTSFYTDLKGKNSILKRRQSIYDLINPSPGCLLFLAADVRWMSTYIYARSAQFAPLIGVWRDVRRSPRRRRDPGRLFISIKPALLRALFRPSQCNRREHIQRGQQKGFGHGDGRQFLPRRATMSRRCLRFVDFGLILITSLFIVLLFLPSTSPSLSDCDHSTDCQVSVAGGLPCPAALRGLSTLSISSKTSETLNSKEAIDLKRPGKNVILPILALLDLSSMESQADGRNHPIDGPSLLKTAQMAVDHVNVRQLIPGFRLQLLVNDSKVPRHSFITSHFMISFNWN